MNTAEKLQLARQAENGSLTDLGKALSELASPTSPIKLASYTVATVPAAADFEGHVIYVTDGADGSPTIAWSDGTNWIEEDGTAIAA